MNRQVVAREAPDKRPQAADQSPSSRAASRSRHSGLQDRLGNRGALALLQAKLRVGHPHDAFEAEADAVTDAVMRTGRPATADMPAWGTVPNIQSLCGACSADNSEEDEEEQVLAPKRPAGQPSPMTPELETQIEAVRGGGQALPAHVREDMEPRIGRDFGHVRIHTDAAAASVADRLQAYAFTVGPDIVFGSGQYDPGTDAGQRLLVHELTHVVQQTDAPTRTAPSHGARHTQAGNPQSADGGGAHPIRGAATAAPQAAGGIARAALKTGPQIAHRSTYPQVQGAWKRSDVRSSQHGSTSRDGHAFGIAVGGFGQAIGFAKAWQVASWLIEGGWARAQQQASMQYTFEHDGADNDYLELTTSASIAGQAKAEDLIYAQGAGAVAGIIKVRTHADPTPAGTKMFDPISQGGRSTASSEPVGDLDVTVPIDGSIDVNIPLKATSEGELAPIDDALSPPDTQEVRGTVGTPKTVDVYLGAYVTTAADIETEFWGLDADVNHAYVTARFALDWRNRASPAPPTPVVPPTTEEPISALRNCQANDNLDETADPFISRCCKGSIRREFPSELLNETLGNIKRGTSATHKKAWKLLNDNRFKK